MVRSADKTALEKAMGEVQVLCFAERFETDDPSEIE